MMDLDEEFTLGPEERQAAGRADQHKHEDQGVNGKSYRSNGNVAGSQGISNASCPIGRCEHKNHRPDSEKPCFVVK